MHSLENISKENVDGAAPNTMTGEYKAQELEFEKDLEGFLAELYKKDPKAASRIRHLYDEWKKLGSELKRDEGDREAAKAYGVFD